MQEVTINKQARLSQHFTLGELTKTKTKIENVPNFAVRPSGNRRRIRLMKG